MSRLTRRDALLAGAGTLVVLAGCFDRPTRSLPKQPTGEWRHRAHDAYNTGSADVAVPPRGTPAWEQGEAHRTAPVISDGTVYSVGDEVTAVDAQTGKTQWETNLTGKADFAPALLGDHLFVAANDPPNQHIVALAHDDGTEMWSTSLPEPVRGALTVTDEPPLVTVPLGETRLLAVDPQTGDQMWHEATVGARQTAIADSTVYVAGYRQDGDTGVLRALSATDGSRLWETDLEHPDGPPIVVNDELLVADSGTLAIHNREDGARLRELGTFGDRIHPSPVVADRRAFVPADGDIVAVSVADGSREWRTNVPVTAGSGVTVGRDAVVAAVTNLPREKHAGIAAFERADGTTRWTHEIEGFHAAASAAPVLADGAVFYASNERFGIVALGDLPPKD